MPDSGGAVRVRRSVWDFRAVLDLDPHLLRAFVAIVEIGTVSGAAVALSRTQAAVSMQIRKLEDLVGVTLFKRSSKGLDLTAEGQVMLPYAREIIRLSNEIGERLSGKVIAGRVRLGVVEDFAATRLTDILSIFRSQNPNVDIDIIVEPNQRLAALFEEGQLDLVVCDITCVGRKPLLVWTDSLLWAVRADISLDATAPLPVIMFEKSCPWHLPQTAALAKLNVKWKVACEASTLVAMATAVRVGIGTAPMIAATIPEGCRALDRTTDLPAPIRIEIGLYARPRASAQARYLVEFICRQSAMAVPDGDRPWGRASGSLWGS